LDYLKGQGVEDVSHVDRFNVRAFLLALSRKKLSTKTVARNLAALRTFFRFLVQEEILKKGPTETIESPKLAKRLPEILTLQEVEHLLEQPDLVNPLGLRDRAMLEMLYATGMRVSELTQLPIHQVNLEGGYVLLYGKGSKERVVPLGSEAMKWIDLYLKKARENWPKGEAAYLSSIAPKEDEPPAFLDEYQSLRPEGWNPKRITPHLLALVCSHF
jgi:integrase/recombinase XerD